MAIRSGTKITGAYSSCRTRVIGSTTRGPSSCLRMRSRSGEDGGGLVSGAAEALAATGLTMPNGTNLSATIFRMCSAVTAHSVDSVTRPAISSGVLSPLANSAVGHLANQLDIMGQGRALGYRQARLGSIRPGDHATQASLQPGRAHVICLFVAWAGSPSPDRGE